MRVACLILCNGMPLLFLPHKAVQVILEVNGSKEEGHYFAEGKSHGSRFIEMIFERFSHAEAAHESEYDNSNSEQRGRA